MKSVLNHPHLRRLLAETEAVRSEAERLRRTLSDAQLTWKPEPGVWSVADCFEHLRKIDKAYIRRMNEAVESVGPGKAAFKPSLFGRGFIHFLSPQSRVKMKAPKGVRPPTDIASAPAEAVDRFLDQQAALLDLLRRADGKDLNAGKFASPLASIVRLSVGEGLTVLVVHEQRHLRQAQRLTERADFPA